MNDSKIAPEAQTEAAVAGSVQRVCSTALVPCGDKFNELKVDINNKMMMYAPETMTIKEADEIACAVVVMITLGKWPVR